MMMMMMAAVVVVVTAIQSGHSLPLLWSHWQQLANIYHFLVYNNGRKRENNKGNLSELQAGNASTAADLIAEMQKWITENRMR